MADEKVITIDGTEYNLDELSEAARTQIGHVRICDQKLVQLQAELGIVRTARATYASALKEALAANASGDADESIEVTAAGDA